jgi:allantoin racemase
VRLLYLLVDELAPSAERVERRLREGQAAMPPNWAFGVEPIRIGPAYYEENAMGHAMAVPGIVHAVLTRQSEYDAILIGCFGDPGLAAARTVARIPIIGPGEASLLLARLGGRTFGITTILASDVPELRVYVSALGLDERCAGIEAIGVPAESVYADLGRTSEALSAAASRLVERGAQVIVLGCMSFGFYPFARELRAAIGLDVIDPLRASIAALQAAATLDIRLGGIAPQLERPEELSRFLARLEEAVPVP